MNTFLRENALFVVSVVFLAGLIVEPLALQPDDAAGPIVPNPTSQTISSTSGTSWQSATPTNTSAPAKTTASAPLTDSTGSPQASSGQAATPPPAPAPTPAIARPRVSNEEQYDN